MKKYLMTGMAAIMFCGVFTSCSRESDFGGQTQQEKIQATYEEAFKTRFGEPAANQDWGFGSSRANTRADGTWANYHGAQTDGHLWTSFGFYAPDPLTDGQKLRVQYYFQMNHITNPNQPNYGEIDFFMQQVYDGGTDPMTKYKDGNYSREVYTSTQNTDVESGQHMDHLTASDDNSLYHVNNFNNGNYPDPIPNVANWNQTVQDDPSQEHEDQIMLMLNTPTKYFGYANSDDSFVHKDMWTLVSAADIDTYCNNNGFADWLSTWNSVNDKNVVDDLVDDDWHRGFIGFDFEMLPGDLVYAKDNNGVINAKFGDATEATDQQYFDGTNFLTYNNWSDEIKVGTKSIPYLNRDGNQYCGFDVKNVGGYDNQPADFPLISAYQENGTNDGSLYLDHLPGQQSDRKALNLKFIAKMYNQGYRPVNNTSLRLWVIQGGCADGYYSDWIVSFLPANYNPGPTPDTVIEKLRVIAEDLSVGERTDFDFNDVVFDVIWTRVYSDETHTELTSQTVQITLLAAGGTLPLYVDGQEVHDLFGVDQHTMVNTNALARGMNGKDDAEPVTWPTTNYSGTTIGEIANSIDVYVMKNDEPCHLSAPVGAIASKIGVGFINGVGYQWCDEREDIDHRYSLVDGTSLFTEWVQGIYPAPDWYTYAKGSIDSYRAAKAAAQAAANGTNP